MIKVSLTIFVLNKTAVIMREWMGMEGYYKCQEREMKENIFCKDYSYIIRLLGCGYDHITSVLFTESRVPDGPTTPLGRRILQSSRWHPGM